MRDYKKMMEEGWINQTVIEQEMAQERRAAKEDYAKAIADLNAEAEKKMRGSEGQVHGAAEVHQRGEGSRQKAPLGCPQRKAHGAVSGARHLTQMPLRDGHLPPSRQGCRHRSRLNTNARQGLLGLNTNREVQRATRMGKATLLLLRAFECLCCQQDWVGC